MSSTKVNRSKLQNQIYEIIFGYESAQGKLFDLVLIVFICASVSAVILDSVGAIHQKLGNILYFLEWVFTILFTIEYVLRLYSAKSKKAYITSFYGLVDLLSILPTYIAFLYPGATYLIVIRVLRVLRVFRILKLVRYMSEANVLLRALLQSRRKILVFLFAVLNLIVIFGCLMFLVEGPENGFTSIPRSMYWAIVTITTVGYGDVIPHTLLGQFIAGLAMITGYAIIAVPTGIVSSELINEYQKTAGITALSGKVCLACKSSGHSSDARYCKDCGESFQAVSSKESS